MTNASIRSLLVGVTALLTVEGVAFAQTPPPAETPPAETPPAETPPAAEVAPTAPTPAPEPTPEPKKDDKPAVEASYDKGLKLESTDGQFEMKLALRTQFRVQVDRPTADGAETTTALTVPRFRLQLEGHVFGKSHRYKTEFAMGDKSSFSFVKDMFIEQGLSENTIWLRVGQWKQPFNRQEIVSDFGSVFNERANTAEFVQGGRDVGIMLHNDYEKSPEGLEWAFGVFQSFKAGTDKPAIATECDPATMECTSKAGSTAPGDWGPALVARVGFNKGKIKGYSEGDLEGGPLRLAAAVSYKIDLADLDGDAMKHGVGVDLMLKVEGFDLFGGFYLMVLPDAMGEKQTDIGFTGQAGYFFMPRKAQVAARFSMVPDGDENEIEARGAFNWYWHGHSWKWATDFGIIQSTADGADPDIQVRSMAQLTF
jgi:hypothetical protein